MVRKEGNKRKASMREKKEFTVDRERSWFNLSLKKPMRHILPDLSGIVKTLFHLYDGNHIEVVSVITNDPLWETMKRKGISTYTLIKDYSLSRGTLDSLKQNRNISTATQNDLCNILEGKVQDVLWHIPDKS